MGILKINDIVKILKGNKEIKGRICFISKSEIAIEYLNSSKERCTCIYKFSEVAVKVFDRRQPSNYRLVEV